MSNVPKFLHLTFLDIDYDYGDVTLDDGVQMITERPCRVRASDIGMYYQDEIKKENKSKCVLFTHVSIHGDSVRVKETVEEIDAALDMLDKNHCVG